MGWNDGIPLLVVSAVGSLVAVDEGTMLSGCDDDGPGLAEGDRDREFCDGDIVSSSGAPAMGRFAD